jgi:predicted RNase H-like nuclease
MPLLGIDGCKIGWVVAEADPELHRVRFWIAATAQELFARIDDRTVAAIDIPIGLPIDKARACDLQARRLLAPYTSRVFPAPARAALGATEYRECCALNEQALQVGLSKQSHALLPKIREVDELITPTLQARVREAHPEVTFFILGGGPLKYGKKTVSGQIERTEVLRGHGLGIGAADWESLQTLEASLDDAVDAAACLLTAQRIARGSNAPPLGDGALDARWLRMEIVA